MAPRRAECLPFLESLYDLATSGLSAGEAVRRGASAAEVVMKRRTEFVKRLPTRARNSAIARASAIICAVSSLPYPLIDMVGVTSAILISSSFCARSDVSGRPCRTSSAFPRWLIASAPVDRSVERRPAFSQYSTARSVSLASV